MHEDDLVPEQIIMDANIKEFGQRISLICALETGGKISSEEAYARIKQTWKELKGSRKGLLGEKPPPA